MSPVLRLSWLYLPWKMPGRYQPTIHPWFLITFAGQVPPVWVPAWFSLSSCNFAMTLSFSLLDSRSIDLLSDSWHESMCILAYHIHIIIYNKYITMWLSMSMCIFMCIYIYVCIIIICYCSIYTHLRYSLKNQLEG